MGGYIIAIALTVAACSATYTGNSLDAAILISAAGICASIAGGK